MQSRARFSKPALRESFQIAAPITLDHAYDDPERLLRIVRKMAPYRLTIHSDFDEEIRRAVGPNFRFIWTAKEALPGTDGDYLLQNSTFIEGGRKLFGAKIVRPHVVMLNLTLPFAAQPWPHVDLPTFLGTSRNAIPDWLRASMGSSRLFERWALPVPAALAWYYRGIGGEFEYWPNGTACPADVMKPPLWNQAVISDNDYMYHRVAAQGRPEDHFRGVLSSKAMLHYDVDVDRWFILDNGWEVAAVTSEGLRISVLWKGLAFRDEADAQRHDSGVDDLDNDAITEIFAEDLRARGLCFDLPSDPASDPVWREVIKRHYPPRIQLDGWKASETMAPRGE